MPNFIFSGLCKYSQSFRQAQTPYVFYTLLGAGFSFHKLASVGVKALLNL